MYYSLSQYESSSKARSKNISNKADSLIQSHLAELDAFLKEATMSWNAYCRSKGMQDGIIITSGYRSPQLNAALSGSAKNSAHMQGWAADTVPRNGNKNEYFKWALEFAKSGVRFDQIIVESSKGSKWVHFGYKSPSGGQRMQTMSYNGSKYSMITTGTPSEGSGNAGAPLSDESGVDGAGLEITPNVLQNIKYAKNDYDWDDPELYNKTPEELDKHQYQQDSYYGVSNKKYGLLMTLNSQPNVLSNAEKRCLYIMKKLMKKLCIDYVQAAGIVGNIGYETDGYYSPSKKVKGKVGLCQWDKDLQLIFDKLHYKGHTMQESTLDEQIDFLVFTITDYQVYKIKRCLDHLAVSNYFWASYFNHTTWSGLFEGLSKDEENMKRKEGSSRRKYSDAAKVLYENNPNVDLENIGDFSGIGIDSRPVRTNNDPKIYTSDGQYILVPEEEMIYSKEVSDEDEDESNLEYYGTLFDEIMNR